MTKLGLWDADCQCNFNGW